MVPATYGAIRDEVLGFCSDAVSSDIDALSKLFDHSDAVHVIEPPGMTTRSGDFNHWPDFFSYHS